MWNVDVKLATELGSQLITALRIATINHQISYPDPIEAELFDMPDGFYYVGMGEDRIVYGYDDIIFKVQWSDLYADSMSNEPNRTELEQGEFWRDKLGAWDNFVIPEMQLIYPNQCEVLIMPYIEGYTLGELQYDNDIINKDIFNIWKQFVDTVAIMDLHCDNVIFNNDVYYLIDLGSDLL